MTLTGSIPLHDVTRQVATDDPRQALREFRAAYPAARLTLLDNVPIRGICRCGRPIAHHETYKHDPQSGAYTCADCLGDKETL